MYQAPPLIVTVFKYITDAHEWYDSAYGKKTGQKA